MSDKQQPDKVPEVLRPWERTILAIGVIPGAFLILWQEIVLPPAPMWTPVDATAGLLVAAPTALVAAVRLLAWFDHHD